MNDNEAYTVTARLVQDIRLERKRLEADLEQRLAPHRVMQEQIRGQVSPKLAELEESEREALEIWRGLHVDLTERRRAALLRGEKSPALELPAGVSTRDDKVVEVNDLAIVPIEFLKPDLAAIKKSERHVPGTSASIRTTLVCR